MKPPIGELEHRPRAASESPAREEPRTGVIRKLEPRLDSSVAMKTRISSRPSEGRSDARLSPASARASEPDRGGAGSLEATAGPRAKERRSARDSGEWRCLEWPALPKSEAAVPRRAPKLRAIKGAPVKSVPAPSRPELRPPARSSAPVPRRDTLPPPSRVPNGAAVSVAELAPSGELLRHGGSAEWLPETAEFMYRVSALIARGLGFERCTGVCLRGRKAVLSLSDVDATRSVAMTGPLHELGNVLRRVGLE